MATTEHTCPHGGTRIAFEPTQEWACGEAGFLCDMCKRDEAENRYAHLQEVLSDCTDRLVEGLALAGILSNPETTRYIDEKHGSNMKAMDKDVVAVIGRVTAALSEREGGEG